MTRASLDKDPKDVQSMFDHVAAKYDVTNDVLSLGQDRYWRREVVRAVAAKPGQRVLDLAAGTGTSSLPFARAGAAVVSSDFSLGMLTEGRRRFPQLPFVAGDATTLPFADDSFDAVTISFGLRNVVDVEAALAEMHRVTKPGGRLVVCEFSHPTWAPFRTVYVEYLMRALPPVARQGVQRAGGLRVPRRVDPRVAHPARARRPDRGRRLDEACLAQPLRGHRRTSPGHGRIGAGVGPPRPAATTVRSRLELAP